LVGLKTCIHAHNLLESFFDSMAYATDNARWRALTIRDANADGHFVYSVKSTNIYCRPTCPGRLARRANVGFHSTLFEAEAAGFRACKRCKPNAVPENPQERAVEKTRLLIDEALNRNDGKPLKLQDLAKKINLTPRYFHKIFKNKTRLTPKEYAKKRAMDRSTLNTIPTLTTTSEESVQPWDWDTYDFSNLVDWVNGSSPVSKDAFVVLEELLPTVCTDLDLDVVGLSQPWGIGYETDWASSWHFDCDSPANPFYDIPARVHHDEKTVPSASPFETDTFALLECDSLTELLRT